MPFRSGTEAQIAEFLDTYEVNYTYESTTIPYTLQCKYKPDFILVNGIHLEVKGYFTPKDRRKMLAVKEQNPDLDIRFVFCNPHQKISKKSKTSYAQWAEKNGFLWTTFYDFPIEWIT